MAGRRYLGVVGIALALGVLVGCGDGGNGGSNRVTIAGDANFPENNGGAPVADAPFIIIDPDRPNDPLLSDVSTGDGRFFGVIRKKVSVAVILNGAVGGDVQGQGQAATRAAQAAQQRRIGQPGALLRRGQAGREALAGPAGQPVQGVGRCTAG